MNLKLNTYPNWMMNVIAVTFLSSISTSALADNKEALKDAIAKDAVLAKPIVEPTPNQVAEVKAAEVKTTEPVAISSEADFKKLDSNGDQKISLKEAVKDKGLSAKFDGSDINRDGMLSVDEYAFYKSNIASKATDSSVVTPTN